MPLVVPITGERRQTEGETPSDANLLMASAIMHQHNQLTQSVPTPKERPADLGDAAAADAGKVMNWVGNIGQDYSVEGRRRSMNVERSPELKGPIESKQFEERPGLPMKRERYWRSWHELGKSRLSEEAGIQDIPSAVRRGRR